MKMTTDDLLDLKKEVEKAKQELSSLEGKREILLETLKSEFNCEFKDVDKVKKKLKDQIAKLDDEKEKIITKLQEDYEF